tara:strand:+ start:134 stop:598 length:465 start_codon:yes stop_codon:yes gene_type:complete
MNMKDYEKRAEALTKEAKQLESTILTYKALAYCTEHGHDWGGALYLTDDGTTVDGLCQNCAVRLTATNVTLQYDEANTEGFGELAGKVIEDIELPLTWSLLSEEEPTPPTNPSETDEKPTLPVESKKETDGTYRVDVSHITGHTGDYIKGKTED